MIRTETKRVPRFWSPRLLVLLVVCVSLLIAAAVFTMRSLATVSDGNAWLVHTQRVRLELGRILQLLTDIETAERGFLVSRDGQFLEPYEAASPVLPAELSRLKELIADNPAQQSAAARLEALAQARAALARRAVELAQGGDFDAARALVTTASGKRSMDAARDLVSQMQGEEERLLAIRNAAALQAQHHAQLAMAAAGALAILLVAFVAIVTERDASRLRRSEEDLSTILRSIGDAAIATNIFGEIRFMNSVAEQLTGWSENDARGLPLDQVFKILNEHTRAAVESPVAKVLREGAIVGLANHTVLIARDGAEHAIEDSGAPIFDGSKFLGVVLVFRDATAQRAAERSLVESEQRFRAAVDAVQGVLWTNSAEGEMRGEQPGWATLTGQQFDEYQGFGWARAVHPQDAQPTIDAWLDAVRERKPFVFEHRVRRSDGEWRDFSIRAIPLIDAGGAVREWVGVHTDVTERRRAEAALREADLRKDVFLATLSHELRNPLAPIRNAAHLLENDALGPEDVERSRLIIARQVRHMASLLDDLLDVSRITRGVFSLKKQYVNLQGLLGEALETARPLIDAKRHTVTLDWPPEPLEVEADPVRLVQVITNLLTNAAKYTDPEGHITIGARVEQETLLISVRDSGIGLAPGMLTKVFEMFSQIEPDQERTQGGLGIGLALVKGLVELHGGRVEARSGGVERGSEFIIRLPHSPVPADARREAASALPEAPEPRSARRVLIADDNQDGAESLAMLLRLSGNEVFVAHTGTDALELASQERPHVAILDIGMPGLSGYEVAECIRREAWGARVTMIAVTGWGQDDDKRRAQVAGFDHHLTKPVDLEVLTQLLMPPIASA
jgi:PAS domain S-box-containing protein